jgi:uncharacterized membrane protein
MAALHTLPRVLSPAALALGLGYILGGGVARLLHRGDVCDKGRGSTWAETRLKSAYVACAGLCGFMLWWVIALPGSCHGTYLEAYKDVLAVVRTDRFMPFSLLTKYGPHLSGMPVGLFFSRSRSLLRVYLLTKFGPHLSVCLTHQLPSIFWSAALPFQLHPEVRRRFPKTHRIVGRVWLSVSALLMYGVYLIDSKHLHYHINDFPSLRLEEAVSLGLPEHVPHLDALVYHFLVTGACALRAAIRRDINEHRRWVCRHIAGGLWVAVQRVLIGVMHFVGGTLLGFDMMDLRIQKAVFGDSAYLGVVLAIAVAEIAAVDLTALSSSLDTARKVA